MGSFGGDENLRGAGATVAIVEGGIDVLAIDDDENVALEDVNEKVEDATTGGAGPQYGEMMMAMKTLYQSEENTGTSSSTESEHGSDIEEGGISHEDDVEKTGDEVVDDHADDANVAPVSEDDVDSVMEKECQESSEAMIGMTPEPSEEDIKESCDLLVPDDSPISPQKGNDRPNKTIFRKGYMGHIIIICQALVHACNSSTPEETTDDPTGENAMGTILEEPSPKTLDSTSSDEISTMCSFETSAVVSSHPPSEQPCDDGETNSAASNTSKKRKDRSPVRDGSHHDDLKRVASSPTEEDNDDDDVEDCSANTFPIPNVLSVEDTNLASPSPNDVTVVEEDSLSSAEQQPPESPPPSPLGLDFLGLSIGGILRRHPLHDRWQNFVVSVLASEMTVQSTPLGGDGQGDQPPQQPTPQQQMQEIMASAIANSCDDGDLFRTDVEESSNDGSTEGGGSIVAVGEIVMDENDLDIAASMMEALSLPPSPNGGGGGDGPPAGHSRRRGSLGGSSLMGNSVLTADGSSAEKDSSASSRSSSTGSNFGSVIQQHPSAGIGFKDYVYDDPLGGVHPFDSNSSSDEEEEEDKNQVDGFSKKNDHMDDDDNDGFMSDAMVVSREDGGDSTKQQQLGDGGSGMKKSGSNSSNSDAGTDDDDDDDDDVPVLDMFVGSFEANFANFDAFESSCSPTPTAATLTDKPKNNNGDEFEVGSGEVGDDDFFAAINSNNTHGAVGTANDSKAEDDAALFEFSKTPFDLVDTLSSLDDDARNDNNAVAAPTSSSFFMEGNNGNEKSS